MVRNTKGFTLIELMVVILIIGILAALAIPKFTNASTKAKFAEIPTVLVSYDHAQLAHVAETGVLAAVGDLVFDPPAASKWFTYNDAVLGSYTGTTSVAVGGGVGAGVLIATTAVDITSHISHTVNEPLAEKYLVNFVIP